MNKIASKLRHQFYIGQEVFWHIHEFDCKTYVRCVITEVHEDYAIAHSEGNLLHPQLDDLDLWIDFDNEMDFFDGFLFRIQL